MYSCYFRTKIFPLETNVNVVLPRIGVPVRIRSESTSKHALTYTPAALESRYDGFLHRSRRRKKSNVFCSLPDHNPRGLVSRSICSLPVSPNHVLAITRGSQDTSRIPLSSAIDWLLLTMMFLSNRSSYLLLFPLHVRIPLVENWRQRWNRSQPETRKPFSHFQLRHRHYQTRWHIFFFPSPGFINITREARVAAQITAAPLVCTRRFPPPLSFSQCVHASRDSKKFSISVESCR